MATTNDFLTVPAFVGASVLPTIGSGEQYTLSGPGATNYQGNTTYNPTTADLYRAWLFPVPQPMVINQIGIQCGTALAATECLVSLWTVSTGQRPGSLIVESGVLSTAATGAVTSAVSNTYIPVGSIYAAIIWNTASTQRIQALPLASTVPLGSGATSGNSVNTFWTVTQTYGAAPSTFPSPTGTGVGAAPLIRLRQV